MAVWTQWRVIALPSGALRYTGLDYTAVRAGLDGEGIAVTPELWTGIRVMEAEARSMLNAAR